MKIKISQDWILSNLRECVRYKSLWNKAEKLQGELRKISEGSFSLMFSLEDEETKREIWKAIDCLQAFKHNLKLKPKYAKIMGGK